MRSLISFAVLSAAVLQASARHPAADEGQLGRSLIKISAEAPAIWVTDEEKERLGAGRTGFVDITDITDAEVLDALSRPSWELKARQTAAVAYPGKVLHKDEAKNLIANVTTDGPKIWLKQMTDMYNRHFQSVNGTLAAAWMFEKVQSIASPNPRIKVSQFKHARFNQPSVIAAIPGKNPELIIVGAHYDSTGGSPSARGPGADDNGSGVVVILEALRVLAAAGFAPTNTLEFHFYAGEEGGLLGSRDIFADYKARKRAALAFVNQDMAGFSPSGRISIFEDFVDAGLTAYCGLIAKEYTGLEPTSDVCGYGCSDHASATSNGFPAAYVCDEVIETSSPFIHTPQDAFETVGFDTILRHSVFTVGFLVEASFICSTECMA